MRKHVTMGGWTLALIFTGSIAKAINPDRIPNASAPQVVGASPTGALYVGAEAGMYPHIADAIAAIGPRKSGAVILTSGYTDAITSTLTIGVTKEYGIKVFMMPGSRIEENITSGSPGIVILDGGSLECMGATSSGTINGQLTSTCMVYTSGGSVNMSAMIASQTILDGSWQDVFGLQGVTFIAGGAHLGSVIDVGATAAPSIVANNNFFGGSGTTYVVHIHNNVGGGVIWQGNQVRGNSAEKGALYYITGSEATGFQGVTGAFTIEGGEASCSGPNAPAFIIDGNPDSRPGNWQGVAQLIIHDVWTQDCVGSGPPFGPAYVVIRDASYIHFSDQRFSTQSPTMVSISERNAGQVNNILFDNITLSCNNPTCSGQTWITDTTVAGYTHPMPTWTNGAQLYAQTAYIMHDEAGQWTHTAGPSFNSVNVLGTATVKGDVNTSGQFRMNGVPLAKVAQSGNYADLAGAPAWDNWGGNVYAPGHVFVQGEANLGGAQDIGAALNVAGWSAFSSNVGIGTITPKAMLDVRGTYDANAPNISSLPILRVNGGGALSLWFSGYAYNGSWIQAIQDDGSNLLKNLYLEPLGGHVGVGTTTPGYTLDVAGQIHAAGGIVFPNGVQTEAYTGTTCGGDYAESVDVSGDRTKYSPGDVLVIDPNAPGRFLKSAEPYSTSVTGIYSTKPGTVGRRQTTPKGADELPMAMIGIVPTKVSAENGPIRPGDLLVTSSKLGYAMKGTDRGRIVGAVVGKALGSLESGSGVIEVVVTLQ